MESTSPKDPPVEPAEVADDMDDFDDDLTLEAEPSSDGAEEGWPKQSADSGGDADSEDESDTDDPATEEVVFDSEGERKVRKPSKKKRARPKTKTTVKKKTLATGRSKLDSPEAIKRAWNRLVGKGAKKAPTYKITNTYAPSDVVSHPQFGVGIVNQIIGHRKIEVLFERSLRKLVHDYRRD